MDPWGALEGVDFKPRVLRHRQLTCRGSVVEGFQARILAESLTGFGGLGDRRIILQRFERERDPRQDPLDLAKLPGIGCGDDQLHRRSPTTDCWSVTRVLIPSS